MLVYSREYEYICLPKNIPKSFANIKNYLFLKEQVMLQFILLQILVFRTHDNKYAKMEIVHFYDSPNPDPSNGDYVCYYTFNYVYQPNDNALFLFLYKL